MPVPCLARAIKVASDKKRRGRGVLIFQMEISYFSISYLSVLPLFSIAYFIFLANILTHLV